MVSLETPLCDFNWKAVDFSLPGVDNKTYSLAEVTGPNGVLVMFICNHCPYVQAVVHRIVRDVRELKTLGIGAIAIMSNDPDDYPEDSFDNMRNATNAMWALTAVAAGGTTVLFFYTDFAGERRDTGRTALVGLRGTF